MIGGYGMMNQEQLNAIKERVAKATPGPWEVVGCNHVWTTLGGSNILGEKAAENDGWLIATVNHDHLTALENGKYDTMTIGEKLAVSEFIANAREDVPALVAEVERLNNQIHVYRVTDDFVREQSKKVKHLFPLENVAGYGQLCDLAVEQEKEIKNLRKALEWYVDDNLYPDEDLGVIARQALGGEANE